MSGRRTTIPAVSNLPGRTATGSQSALLRVNYRIGSESLKNERLSELKMEMPSGAHGVAPTGDGRARTRLPVEVIDKNGTRRANGMGATVEEDFRNVDREPLLAVILAPRTSHVPNHLRSGRNCFPVRRKRTAQDCRDFRSPCVH